jgi:hypothetical protein
LLVVLFGTAAVTSYCIGYHHGASGVRSSTISAAASYSPRIFIGETRPYTRNVPPPAPTSVH